MLTPCCTPLRISQTRVMLWTVSATATTTASFAAAAATAATQEIEGCLPSIDVAFPVNVIIFVADTQNNCIRMIRHPNGPPCPFQSATSGGPPPPSTSSQTTSSAA